VAIAFFHTRRSNAAVEITDVYESKLEALRQHRSQGLDIGAFANRPQMAKNGSRLGVPLAELSRIEKDIAALLQTSVHCGERADMDTKESRYVTVARIAYHLAQEVLPLYSHPKSPQRFRLCLYTLSQWNSGCWLRTKCAPCWG
jgi:hypothetical protein